MFLVSGILERHIPPPDCRYFSSSFLLHWLNTLGNGCLNMDSIDEHHDRSGQWFREPKMSTCKSWPGPKSTGPSLKSMKCAKADCDLVHCSKSDPSGFHLEVKWDCTAKLPSKITALKNKLYWNKICWLRLDFGSQHIQQSLPAQYWSCGLFLTLLEQDWELSTQTVNSMDKKNILFFLTTASLQKMWIFSVTWIIICC